MSRKALDLSKNATWTDAWVRRFWARVVDRGDCSLWVGGKNLQGYGLAKDPNGAARFAHRLAYAQKVGPLTKGLFVLHACDNPACVKPEHLSLGTQAENMLDANKKGRNPRGEQHGNAKLKESEVRAIHKEARLGKAYKEIADLYKVSARTVGEISRGEVWRYLDLPKQRRRAPTTIAPETRREIMDLVLASPLTGREIARLYGVSASAVSENKRRALIGRPGRSDPEAVAAPEEAEIAQQEAK